MYLPPMANAEIDNTFAIMEHTPPAPFMSIVIVSGYDSG